ncbi:EAL domain-containing protein [Pseudoalteromonas sp. SSDWG2]|uniref:EAL domain-containing protein n=1 Tax=Pseudoalteromonas sp. SSDWG2 TaxID=3139391 RepID=UPI003BABDD2E
MQNHVFDVFTRGAAKLAANTIVLSLREGYVALIPFFVMAALVSLVTHILGQANLSGWSGSISSFNTLIWALFPIVTLFSFSYYLAKNLKLNTIALPILVFICFSFSTDYLFVVDSTSLGINYRSGVLYTILMPIFCCYLMRTMLASRSFRFLPVDNASLFLVKHLNLMFPYFLVLIASAVIFPLLDEVFNLIKAAFFMPDELLSSNEKLSLQIIGSHLLWLVGVHGDNAYYILSAPQLSHYTMDFGLDNMSYLNSFVLLGGAGCMWGLVIACCLQGHKSYESSIAKLGAPLVLFNLSEILIYALPIVFNPYFLIPFILAPLTNALLSDMVFASGLITLAPDANVPWFMPVFINGFLATNSVGGALWQAVLIAINVLIYLPFVKAHRDHSISGRELDVLVKRVSTGRQLERQIATQFAKRDSEKLIEQQALTKAIAALDEGTLCLYYQPKVCKHTEQVLGYEALLRFKDAKGNVVAPWFIDILEQFDMMDVVDSYVIDQLELDLQQFKRHNLHPKISFNISPKNLINRRYKRVIKAFSKFPQQVEVEILESTYIDDFNRTQEIVGLLQQQGIRCAIDDFGTGYSCLHILSKLNVDTIKLDRSLLPLDSEDKAIHLYESLTQMCNQLGFEVIAEGIETEFHKRFIAPLAVSQLQGYYFDEPLHLEQAMRQFATHASIPKRARAG